MAYPRLLDVHRIGINLACYASLLEREGSSKTYIYIAMLSTIDFTCTVVLY